MSALKTVFLMEDLCYGGTQRQTLELAARLDRRRFSPAMLVLTGETDLDDEARAKGIQLCHMGTARSVAPFFFARLGRHLSRVRPDILVTCTALPNIWGRIWGKALKVPLILGTVRGGGAPARQHEKLLWRLADHIVCNSRASTSKMTGLGVPPTHLSYIANGVDTARFCPAAEVSKNPVIVCVARLAKDKDHTTLLRAFALLVDKMPEARLRLVGDGPERDSLAAYAHSLGQRVFERVEFAGACTDPLPFYQNAAVCALASQREGQPNALLEAMSCGLPICATAVGGIPDLAQGHGLLSKPGDAEAFALNLEAILSQPRLGYEFGARGRSFVEANFSFERMVNQHQDLFAKLMKERV